MVVVLLVLLLLLSVVEVDIFVCYESGSPEERALFREGRAPGVGVGVGVIKVDERCSPSCLVTFVLTPTKN